jgi:lysophospholipase L1-like esterase
MSSAVFDWERAPLSSPDSLHPVRILCFGDSNTWGYNPNDGSRYSRSVRWTGVLQALLGSHYEVIEEGLNGRTTDLDYADRVGKNGKTYLSPCMDSHHPLDYVILSLGPNDLKTVFNRSAEKISEAIEQLVLVTKGAGLEKPSPEVKIILVAPPVVREGIGIYGDALKGATAKSVKLVPLLKKISDKHRLTFVNLFDQIEPSSIDGVHFSADSHQKIGKIFYDLISAECFTRGT